MRIAFAVTVRDPALRRRSAIAISCGIMWSMDTLDQEIQAAAKKRTKAEAEFRDADEALRALMVQGRAEGKGPSHMARLTGFTREWVAKIAPAPKP